ncbi:staphylococcal nuclease-like protein [Nitzschia inconspicua]|uniref:Staphylococcal nuclease-like protein n=1 Tax=Nitzschia inconspicua TaxID=303405 RepID=A0A9K3Q155_9STRA|nr:staphylococcal nuclease-like protein [Nitzschia inconspicua]
MAAVNPRPTILPSRGVARVKSVLSGDTLILTGKAASPNEKAPEVIFTLENISAPRLASKANNNVDEPGAFPAREWLRQMVVGKMVNFETRKQGALAGDRVYGLLTFTPPGATPNHNINLAVEAVRNGYATPKMTPQTNGGAAAADGAEEADGGEDDEYKMNLWTAYDEAKRGKLGIHSGSPLVRKIKNAGDDFQASKLVETSQKGGGKIKCVIEYVFDGSRCRVQITDPSAEDLIYGSFTLLMAGIASPRVGNPRADPPIKSEDFADEARTFSEQRILQRELEVVLLGTDKSGVCCVGSILHPKGNIAVELLKNGLAKMSDWSVRMMDPADVPALRIAENTAKKANLGVWHSYVKPSLSGAAEITGTVVEVLSGDTISILPDGQTYDSDDKLMKISLASIRAPRVGNERAGRADEPYSHECKDRLRLLTVGKQCKVQVHYERDIPLGDNSEKRKFGTVSTKSKGDVGEVLITEGLATTQFHKDGEETSPRYDELRAAEAIAKASKKGMHSEKQYKSPSINDLSDPKKIKTFSESLIRAGKLKAVVEYCFNGSRFKLLIPSENCYIMFAPDAIRSPQPSPPATSTRQTRPAEPFGDASKNHARLTLLQRNVEIDCTGVTKSGVVTGSLFVGQAGQRKDYRVELVGAGLATVDQRKIDYGEAPKQLVDAQMAAQNAKIGVWSIETVATENPTSKGVEQSKDEPKTIRISEIRSGTHFFYNLVGDEGAKIIDDCMKTFTINNGTDGAPCDIKVNKVVAALFDDGSGKSWYRAKILEKQEGGTKAVVLFLDHGNVATVPVATHLRPLDESLGTDKIPPVAIEATLCLTLARPLSDEYGHDAARMFQSTCWGKDLSARTFGKDESGKVNVVIATDSDESINEMLVSSGLARVAPPKAAKILAGRMADGSSVLKLAADLNVAQETARKTRAGMWRYGDIGDDDEDI